ncbi:uncharacterized protein LOC131666417 [Phymastichus coffea]|uniref:uncharacterized protein LOC131666417 n=1 Tax=Phymastichus coffea TaxID=108790 RepID=UPI00273B2BE1|nr:uncharacterized protein LOC131666417 [Phymastichus coffea]
MRFPRYFLTLCALFFVAIAVNAEVDVDVDVDVAVDVDVEDIDDVEERNPLLAAAVVIIRQAVKWAATHCAKEAASNCKQHWKNPKALVNCAKNFLQKNKGRCVLG